MKRKKFGKFAYTLASIIFGLAVGGLILVSIGIDPFKAYRVILEGAFGKPKFISWTIVQAVPIILTGISVAFAFNTGLFNIGAEGQYIVGSLGAVIAGVILPLPPGVHAIVALIIGAVCGLIWGGLVGFFKARFGVNEVISSIMLNWIALYFSNWLLEMPFLRKPESDNSYSVLESASIRFLDKWKHSDAGIAYIKEHPVVKGLLNPPVNWGIVIAIIMAVVAWYILSKTTLGYQLKAVGFNKDAAEYGGINVKKNFVVSMAIAGAFSGLAGAITVLGVTHNIGILAGQQGYGFNGIAVSLIAGNSPLACIPSGLLFSALTYGGGKLNSKLNTPSEIINIFIGIIVFFIAMPKLLDMLTNLFGKKKGGKKDA